MSDEATHPSLLSRVRDPGDAAAWREFDARYGPLILGYCRRLGLQLNDAEDVRQNVMADLSKALSSFRFDPQRGRFRTYLARVVHNGVSRHFRSRGRLAGTPGGAVLEYAPAGNAHDGDSAWEREWILHHYRLALRELRSTCEPRSVDVFNQLVAGRSIEDVATMFSMTPEAVRKTKQRLKERMRIIVAAQIEDEDHPDGC